MSVSCLCSVLLTSYIDITYWEPLIVHVHVHVYEVHVTCTVHIQYMDIHVYYSDTS